ncbi:MAG: hypothetical protein K8W52_01670 [Deltaproteobacteria bacterium]|nr:hypothetical protein [Deltaproteobacteria bacterium]
MRRRFRGVAVGGAGLAAVATDVVLGLQARGLADVARARCLSPSMPCADAV